jgi:nucleotide-binding universal stress UspA family protein
MGDAIDSVDTSATERVFLVVVDDSPEMKNALYFACKRARRTSGRVGLLQVIEPADFQHWAAVGNLMREEARAEAERLLQETAAMVIELHGKLPILYVLEGDRKQELLKLIDEDPQIRILVLAAATGKKGPGPLISFLTKKVIGKMRIPVTIVPGGLTEEQIDALS